uniref:AP2/ERF domain-containing protein n=1 Tax=Mucochytrium quahogii TaxID=96639 RepID=A0A7S2SAF6_9STRA|mmetsp:Transcript_3099/g.6554  ORF Transcript_3099/g.6554 Transcript_3099/m.6554 type:complete len:314 (+) Transcript_3099:2007-2948(+)
MGDTGSSGRQDNIPRDIDKDKQTTSRLELTTLSPHAVSQATNVSGNLIGDNSAWGTSMGQLWQVGWLNNPMNNPGFQQHGAIPSGLPGSVPSQTKFLDWSNAPFMSQAIRASQSVGSSSLHSYRINGLSVGGVLPYQQAAQPPQSYTAGMVLANVGSLCSVATGGTGGAKLKRSLSETQRQPEGLLPSSPPVRPRKKSLGQRAYNSEPPQGSSSTFTESVDTAKRTSLYRGVSYHRRDRKWTARTWLKGKMVHIGMYKSEKMAALMVDLKNLEVLGSDCHKKLNFTPLERHTLAKELAQEPRCPLAILYYARD